MTRHLLFPRGSLPATAWVWVPAQVHIIKSSSWAASRAPLAPECALPGKVQPTAVSAAEQCTPAFVKRRLVQVRTWQIGGLPFGASSLALPALSPYHINTLGRLIWS